MENIGFNLPDPLNEKQLMNVMEQKKQYDKMKSQSEYTSVDITDYL